MSLDNKNTWETWEIEKVQKAAAEMLRREGKINQRGLSKILRNKVGSRSEAAIYVRIREMMRGGTWWNNKPVSNQIICKMS